MAAEADAGTDRSGGWSGGGVAHLAARGDRQLELLAARSLSDVRTHPTANSQTPVRDFEQCRFCGGSVRFRLIGGSVRPLRGTCSCPQPGGPTKPLLQDKFCWRTECRFCGRKPVYFVRHNGGSVFFDELGHPWPKHECLRGDDYVLVAIRQAVKNTPTIRFADLYQVLERE